MTKLFTILMLLTANLASANFTSEDEVSLISTGGNTELKTYDLSSNNKYVLEKNIFSLNGSYTYGENDSVRSAEEWLVLLRYERELSKKIGIFVSQDMRSNRFSGYSRRYNSDLGMKYIFVKTEKNTSYGEIGYRYTIEKKVDESIADQKNSNGRVYLETDQEFKKGIKGKLWGEYIPNFEESDDYLMNVGSSLSVVLTDIFSLKLAYTLNYDNEPVPGNGKHDYKYTTGLLASF